MQFKEPGPQGTRAHGEKPRTLFSLFLHICLYSYLCDCFHKDAIDCLLKIKFRKGHFKV